MQDKNLSEITYVRLSTDQRNQLERIAAANSMTRRVSDHIRFAVDQYIANHSTVTPVIESAVLPS